MNRKLLGSLLLGLVLLTGPVWAGENFDAVRARAEAGDANAQHILEMQYVIGIKHPRGLGVDKDLVEGYAWLNVAAVEIDDAKDRRDEITKNMTPAQIGEAQALSREYWKAYGGSGD